MFEESPFNEDISNWNMAKATDLDYMFFNARSFSKDLCSWGSKLSSTLQGPSSSTDDPEADSDNLRIFLQTNCLYDETLFNPTCSGGGKWTQLCTSACDSQCYGSSTRNVQITASGSFWDLYRAETGTSNYRWIASGFSGTLSRGFVLNKGLYSLEGFASSASVSIQRSNGTEVLTSALNSVTDIAWSIN